MPKLSPLQTSFSAGELSPRLAARTDARGYKEGVNTLGNFIPLSQGPAIRRPGTFKAAAATSTNNGRLVPFPVAADELYILALYNDQMAIFDETGNPVRPNKLLNPRFQQAGANWTTFDTSNPTPGIITFGIGFVTLNPSAVKIAAIRQQGTGLTIGNTYKLTFYGRAGTNFRVRAGTTVGGSEFGEAFSGLTSNEATVAFVATGATVECECAALVNAVDSVLVSCSLISEQDSALILTTPWNANSLALIQYEMAPAGRVMYFTHPLFPPQKLTLSQARAWDFIPVAFTLPPAEWVTNNYPSALTFFQGRLWFGGTPFENSKFWGSKSGVYEDFTTGTAADDSVVFQIAKRGTIRWMTGLKSLLIGTDNSEFVITSEAGVITPTDIKIEPQSSFGSAALQPYQVGNQVLYVSPDRVKLRTMGYRFEEQGWVTQDLTFAAEHITAGRIAEIAYCQNPESVIWMVDQFGALLGCTYDRANNIIGWHKHFSPEISWFSCCSGRFFGVDWLWVAGIIQLAAGPELVICNMQTPTSPGPWMDAAVTVVGTAPTTVFSGFAHLEGKTVSVIADGAVQPDVVVVGGTITIQAAALEVTAGLPFTSTVVTNPIEVGQNPKGSEQTKKHNNRVYLRFNSSKYPIINGVRPPTRFPQTPMNTSGAAFSGDVFATSLGWNRIEQVTVEENLPIPLTILGIFLETGVEMPE